MKAKIQTFVSTHTNLVLVAALILVILGGIIGYNKIFVHHYVVLNEVDLPFTPDGPYAILSPRRDGNALVLNIKRVADYDAISYDLAYQSDGIDRGVHGDVKKLTDINKKSEYSQEILFGTCSQGFTSGGAHCVFDKDVENGTLTLHIQKGDNGYRMNTQWHLQQPDVALGIVTSGDNHFTYKTPNDRLTLAGVGYTIVNDLSGVPKLPLGKMVLGKVYALNPPPGADFPAGVVSFELADKAPSDAKIAYFSDKVGDWSLLDTQSASGSGTLITQGNGAGIFAVLVNDTSKK